MQFKVYTKVLFLKVLRIVAQTNIPNTYTDSNSLDNTDKITIIDLNIKFQYIQLVQALILVIFK